MYAFFTELDSIRNRGLEKVCIDQFLNSYYSYVMVSGDDDVMLERRFTSIMEELTELCASPFFWKTDFTIYMEKWESFFKSSWFKNV
ncbi:hypothetical protein MODO_3350 [Myroides odoratimimus]|uniref:Uncharacterized protein n=2 Tax=Myroides odoratimimus TaxID=76832 RepID=A0ABN0MN64_9FLAO|nr:hypothetical protein [Myroides odoratimimus]EHO13468.1 hypothetical protein HMPREF9715_01342 [Myroides odoratimimus CIP 101113]EPC08715.1 hypothetical protein HMPREF9712_03567 [Myroides odoratimimus CCUG 10230]GAQ15650.1 hypothetical protein MODO_3350 [Myroides odoratimimus]STZ47990.1 Uncharacterised protein [Myroides odoratimimus]